MSDHDGHTIDLGPPNPGSVAALREQVAKLTAERDRLRETLKTIVVVNPTPPYGSTRLTVTDWAEALDRVQYLAADALDETGR